MPSASRLRLLTASKLRLLSFSRRFKDRLEGMLRMRDLWSRDDESWLAAWTDLINSIGRTLDGIEALRKDLLEEIESDPFKRRRLSHDLAGVRWAQLYELSNRRFFLQASIQMLGLKGMRQVVNEATLVLQKGRPFDASAPNGLPISGLPRRVSAMNAWDAQVRSKLIYGRTVNDLLRLGRAGSDEWFFKAIKIDPAVALTSALQERLYIAVALKETPFLTRLTTSLREPAASELKNSRLRATLLLLTHAGQMERLNERLAAELFIRRTRLYASAGPKDAERSLWRQIQRWREELRQ